MVETHQLERASELYQKASSLRVDAVCLCNLASCQNRLGRAELALRSAESSIDLDPFRADAWLQKGLALNHLGQYEAALEGFQRALQLNPTHLPSLINVGVTLCELGRKQEAINVFESAIKINPSSSSLWSNLGTALNETLKHEEALRCFERAIALDPRQAGAWTNQGVALGDLNRLEDSFKSFSKALAIKSDDADAHYQRALVLLQHKDFSRGFVDYSWRWNAQRFSSSTLVTGLPPCQGVSSGDSILLWGEQGVGDEIFYGGLLKNCADRGANLTLICDRRLHPIYKRSFQSIELIERDSVLDFSGGSKFKSHAPIGDLGRLLNLDESSIKATRGPYLKADPCRSAEFRRQLNRTRGRRMCGVSWMSANKDVGLYKSLDLKELASLIAGQNFDIVNLQYCAVNQDIQQLELMSGARLQQANDLDLFEDLDGLISLIDACDLVITASNVTAHLAGAIGKRTALLVPFSRGRLWYWHNESESLWYPNTRIFRQSASFSWSRAAADARSWISELDICKL